MGRLWGRGGLWGGYEEVVRRLWRGCEEVVGRLWGSWEGVVRSL